MRTDLVLNRTARLSPVSGYRELTAKARDSHNEGGNVDGEFSRTTTAYIGKGTLNYEW